MKSQRNKAILLPLSKNLMTLATYIMEIMNNSIEVLKSKESSMEKFRCASINLQKNTLTQVVVFNREKQEKSL